LFVDRYLEFNKIRGNWKGELKGISFGQPGKFTLLQDSILSVVVNDIRKNYLSVSKPDKKLSILKVVVKAKDEDFAKQFNDALVYTVNTFYIDTIH
jgi:hypothetical protein